MKNQEDVVASLHKKIGNKLSDIEKEIHGLTIPKKLIEVANEHGDIPIFSKALDKRYKTWKTYTLSELKDVSYTIAAGLLSLNVQPKDIVHIIARPRVEHHLADYGILCSGAISSSIYPQLLSKELSYITTLTESNVIFVDNDSIFKELKKVCDASFQIKHIIMMDYLENHKSDHRIMSWQSFLDKGKEYLKKNPSSIDDMVLSIKPTDIAQIIFTSGTTGEPKGVMLSHYNILSNCCAPAMLLPKDLTQVGFLPMAHAFAKIVNQYILLFTRSHNYCVQNIAEVKLALVSVKPHWFAAVPRLFEKIYDALNKKIKESGKDKIMNMAIQNGLAMLLRKENGKQPTIGQHIKQLFFKRVVFSKILAQLGLENLKFCLTGASAMNPDIQRWFTALGLNIVEGYGLTETSPALTLQFPGVSIKDVEHYYDIKMPLLQTFGSPGMPLPGTQLKINDAAEICAKGPQIFQGYFKHPEKTNECFDSDGWFLTGDYGEFTEYGELKISGRKKELIITSGGKNIAPVKIENLVTSHAFVGQAMVIGDDRKYLSMLISLSLEGALSDWIKEKNLEKNLSNIIKNEEVIKIIDDHVVTCNVQLANFETIKKFVLVPDEWTDLNGLLTPTMKMRRAVIFEKYKSDIEGMY